MYESWNLFMVYWIICTVLACIAAILWLGEVIILSYGDSKEPPYARANIPLIGHAMGLMWHGTSYYDSISAAQQSSMYTISVVAVKLYVTNSIELIGAVQRTARTISFTPFQTALAKLLSRPSKKVFELLDDKTYTTGSSYIRGMDKVTHSALSPGPDLDDINLHTAKKFMEFMEDLPAGQGEEKTLKFYNWIRYTVTVASTTGLYGPLNPYLSRDCEAAFWTFEGAIRIFFARLPVWLFAPKVHRATTIMTASFEKYLRRNGHEQASAVIRNRHRCMVDSGMSLNDMARMEWPLAIAILSNTIPSCFWLFYEILTRPTLLEEIRTELAGTVTRNDNIKDDLEAAITKTRESFVLNIAKMRTNCPILLSVWQETQRCRSRHASIRQVVQDTTLDSRYLLKKGNIVQLPTGPVHRNKELWGADADTFDPYRFSAINRPKPAPNSLLPWGFSPHVCPARHFATTEILMLVGLVLLRFDIVPQRMGAKWEELEGDTSSLSTMFSPKKEVEVSFLPRDGWQGEWSIDVGSSTSKFALVGG